MKKLVLVIGLILGLSAMAEDAATTTKTEDTKTGAMATMKKEAKKVEEKAKELKEGAEGKATELKDKVVGGADDLLNKFKK